ncbi:hypothetical protein BDW71DRAFT_130353 [Aspergillus fruticulosus]
MTMLRVSPLIENGCVCYKHPLKSGTLSCALVFKWLPENGPQADDATAIQFTRVTSLIQTVSKSLSLPGFPCPRSPTNSPPVILSRTPSISHTALTLQLLVEEPSLLDEFAVGNVIS